VCRERCIVVLRDAIVVARAQQSETVWRQRKNYGIDGIRASWVPHLRARARERIRARFSPFACRPSASAAGFSPPVG